MNNLWTYIFIMIVVTNLIRIIPPLLIRGQISNRFLRSFLYYVPYVTLAVMTFPAITEATSSPLAGAIALVLGIIAGNILPVNIVSALSVALYGMFIAIIIPPSKKDHNVGIAVCCSFVLSGLCAIMPIISEWSSGTRTILLTIIISAVAAIIKPIK